jgi:hypothetical protein
MKIASVAFSMNCPDRATVDILVQISLLEKNTWFSAPEFMRVHGRSSWWRMMDGHYEVLLEIEWRWSSKSGVIVDPTESA